MKIRCELFYSIQNLPYGTAHLRYGAYSQVERRLAIGM
jgi:hypothetical protein